MNKSIELFVAKMINTTVEEFVPYDILFGEFSIEKRKEKEAKKEK